MATTSIIPEPWADRPWPILSTPQGEGQDIVSSCERHLFLMLFLLNL